MVEVRRASNCQHRTSNVEFPRTVLRHRLVDIPVFEIQGGPTRQHRYGPVLAAKLTALGPKTKLTENLRGELDSRGARCHYHRS